MSENHVDIKASDCKGCRLCVEACPQGVIQLAPERLNLKGFHPAEMIAMGCTGCGICAIVCPEVAITVYREIKAREEKANA